MMPLGSVTGSHVSDCVARQDRLSPFAGTYGVGAAGGVISPGVGVSVGVDVGVPVGVAVGVGVSVYAIPVGVGVLVNTGVTTNDGISVAVAGALTPKKIRTESISLVWPPSL